MTTPGSARCSRPDPVWNLFVMVTRTASDLAAVNVYQRYWQPSPDTIIDAVTWLPGHAQIAEQGRGL